MKYSDEQRIEKILNYAVKLQDFVSDNKITKELLLANEILKWQVTTPLRNICEHLHNLTKEYKDGHSEIEWNLIADLRFKLMHDYEELNWERFRKLFLNICRF